jgi:hypothetical protein
LFGLSRIRWDVTHHAENLTGLILRRKRIQAHQAPKVKSWMPTRPLTGEGSTNREEVDKHLFDPPG